MPEMISKKLRIMKDLTTLLEGITPAWTDLPPEMQGQVCPHDLSQSVFRGRLDFGDEVAEPFLVILEAPRQLNPNGAGSGDLLSREDWTLLIQGFAKDNAKHPSDPAYDLLAWTQMRLARITTEKKNGARGGEYPQEWRLGGLLVDVRYQIPIVRPGKDDVSGTAYFYMPISVGNVTDLTMPFIEEE
jgi:hypothetical protein